MAAADVICEGSFRRDAAILADRRRRSASQCQDYRPMVVAYRNRSPVVLSEVAEVSDGVENANQAAWMNTTPAVIVNIQRQPGANVIQVVDRIKRLLPALRSSLPAGVMFGF